VSRGLGSLLLILICRVLVDWYEIYSYQPNW